MSNHESGMRGQHAAEQYLTSKGLCVLERNFRIKTGEIDLIMQHGAYTVFVEVKYRSHLRYGYPREAVDARKQRRIKQTALYYITQRRLSDCDFRFDVAEVLNENGQLTVTHIENAFM